ncbi:MAG: response regulator transcription factor, partial [Acidobacteria bacterium]|nr:response regulator transcription factor [Acidobacteriota bacterium]
MTAKLRAYLVDDEPLALKRLRRLLDATGRVEIVGSAVDPQEALAFLSSREVDVLFLDIQMPETNGFELLSRLERQPLVIFTTAFDQYALKAFEVNSIDYLLKPVEPQQLERALNKLERLRGGSKPEWMRQPEFRAVLEELSEALRAPQPALSSRIASRVGDRVQLVDLARITHFFSQDKLTYAAAGGKNHCIDYTITELEQKLDPGKFV